MEGKGDRAERERESAARPIAGGIFRIFRSVDLYFVREEKERDRELSAGKINNENRLCLQSIRGKNVRCERGIGFWYVVN